MTAMALGGLLALAGCSGQTTPTASAPTLGEKTGVSVNLEDLPTVTGEPGETPQIAYPLLPGATSPAPSPTETAPADGEETPEPETSPTPEVSPYVDPPSSLQVLVVGEEGTGEEVTAEDLVSTSFISWTWGQTDPLYSLNTYFTADPFVFSLQTDAALGVLSRVVVGQKIGSRLMAVVPPALGELNTALGGEAGTTTVLVIDLMEKWPQSLQAQADAVPTGVNTGPQINGQLGQEASVSVPGGVTAPEEFTVQVIAEGSGPEAAVGDTVLIHYAGADWTGAEAGSSWQTDKGPVAVTVPDNTQEQITVFAAIAGVKVGSRILVTMPSKEQAYPAGAVVIDVVALVAALPGGTDTPPLVVVPDDEPTVDDQATPTDQPTPTDQAAPEDQSPSPSP